MVTRLRLTSATRTLSLVSPVMDILQQSGFHPSMWNQVSNSRQNDLAKLTDALDIPEYLADALGDDEQRNLRIIQCLLELANSHDRILVFAASVANSRLLASVCRAVGLHADVVTGGTDKVQRKQVIERFKSPDAQKRILINYGVLTTGFDAPAASAVLIARPTRSLVLYSQMVGRVIRGPRAGGTESCQVITVVDTSLPGFRDVAEAFANWEDIWTPQMLPS